MIIPLVPVYAVSPAVVSSAISVQLPTLLIVRALNVATPPLSVAESDPPKVHEETISKLSESAVITFPYVSSVATLNAARIVFAGVVVGGATVNPSFAGPAGVTTIVPLVTPEPPAVVSFAVIVHDVPVSMMTLLKGTGLAAVLVSVPANVQFEVIVM
ncbi:MAG: hypothetical protein WCA31_03125, partial [Acidimicrobiales bacterium]